MFHFRIKEWNKLDAKLRNLPPVSRIKKSLLTYFKTDENSIFDVHNPTGIKLLNSLRLNFSHLNEHKFCHKFWDTVNPFCLCNSDTATTSHYLDNALLNRCDYSLANILLYGSFIYSCSMKNKMLWWRHSIKIKRWHHFNIDKTSMFCWLYHVDVMLTLWWYRVFRWALSIANCHNFIFKKNYFLCNIFIKAFDFMNLLGPALS